MQLQRGDLLYFHETLQLLIARALPLFRHVFPRSLCTFAEPGSKEERNHCLKEVVKVDLLDSRWDTSIVRTTKVSDLGTNFSVLSQIKIFRSAQTTCFSDTEITGSLSLTTQDLAHEHEVTAQNFE